MKILYSYKEGITPVFLDKNGIQRLLLMFQDSGNIFAYYCDDYLRNVYLNKVSKNSIIAETLSIENMSRIQSDEQFDYYINWINNNYNYNGQHISEKISGHDLGGPVLVDLNGNTLIK